MVEFLYGFGQDAAHPTVSAVRKARDPNAPESTATTIGKATGATKGKRLGVAVKAPPGSHVRDYVPSTEPMEPTGTEAASGQKLTTGADQQLVDQSAGAAPSGGIQKYLVPIGLVVALLLGGIIIVPRVIKKIKARKLARAGA